MLVLGYLGLGGRKVDRYMYVEGIDVEVIKSFCYKQ